ncbi:hypothetical protein [Pontibacter sp. H249]|uniref:hypothetical protein n=1 Tax=Pontibacter sp. H249 TaxID=3133420 RepID=UPI0030C2E973
MKRYLFWLLMWIPWLGLYAILILQKQETFPWFTVMQILILNIIVVNIRRKQVGLSIAATLKSMVPGIGYHEWRRLYFAKP